MLTAIVVLYGGFECANHTFVHLQPNLCLYNKPIMKYKRTIIT